MKPAHQGRSVARLAAIQALYQMEVSGAGVEAVIREFLDHRFDADLEGEQLAGADIELFSRIVRGVIEQQDRIDAAVARRLAQNWRLERIDATLRAMFRSGAYELMFTDVPVEIVIDEYVEIAKTFFDGPEPGFVNAALDAIARDERA